MINSFNFAQTQHIVLHSNIDTGETQLKEGILNIYEEETDEQFLFQIHTSVNLLLIE